MGGQNFTPDLINVILSDVYLMPAYPSEAGAQCISDESGNPLRDEDALYVYDE